MRRLTIVTGFAVVVVVGKADVLAGQNKASGSEAALDCGAPYVDHNLLINCASSHSSCLTVTILMMYLLSIRAIAMTRLK
jgi:hypothetical protein